MVTENSSLKQTDWKVEAKQDFQSKRFMKIAPLDNYFKTLFCQITTFSGSEHNIISVKSGNISYGYFETPFSNTVLPISIKYQCDDFVKVES